MTAARRKYFATLKQGVMKQTMFLAYLTDVWHTHESRELIGVCSNINSSVNICHQRAIKDNHQIDFEQDELLRRIHQTQGYSEQYEFYIEEHPIDNLI